MSASYLSTAAVQGPIPASLQDAIAQVNVPLFQSVQSIVSVSQLPEHCGCPGTHTCLSSICHCSGKCSVSSVISISWLIGSSGGHEGQFSRDLPPFFSVGGHCKQLWHGQGCPLSDIVQPVFPLLTVALPMLQGASKDGFGEMLWCFFLFVSFLVLFFNCEILVCWQSKFFCFVFLLSVFLLICMFLYLAASKNWNRETVFWFLGGEYKEKIWRGDHGHWKIIQVSGLRPIKSLLIFIHMLMMILVVYIAAWAEPTFDLDWAWAGAFTVDIWHA